MAGISVNQLLNFFITMLIAKIKNRWPSQAKLDDRREGALTNGTS